MIFLKIMQVLSNLIEVLTYNFEFMTLHNKLHRFIKRMA